MSNPIITNTSFSASGLPTGLSINPNTGVVSGTPTVVGSSIANVTCDTDFGRDTKSVAFNVMQFTTPLIDITEGNYDYISYLPFDDTPTRDIANQISWENHGCELLATGEGAHNNILSFGNGGYMIGTGNFNLYDADGLGGVQMEVSVYCANTDNQDVQNYGCFICLYNDDYSNYIAFTTGRTGNPTAPNLAFLLNGDGATYYNAYWDAMNYGPVAFWQNGIYPVEIRHDSRIYTRPETGRDDYTLMIQQRGHDNNDATYVCDLNRSAGFTHIAINYNPLHPETRIDGSIGAFYLRKY